MKLQRLFMLGCMVLAMGLITSCSGEDGTNGTNGADGADGATGPAGAAGADGADGADGIACWDLNGNGVGDFEEDINGDEFIDALDCQGADGADGADGNANVRRLIFDVSDVLGGTNPVILDNVNIFPLLGELSTETLETHAVLAYAKTVFDTYVPLPGSYSDQANLFNFGIVYSAERIFINEFTFQGWTTDFAEIHLVLIEQSSVSGGDGGGMNVKAHTNNIKASFKAAQVDINNYHEVVKYLGIE